MHQINLNFHLATRPMVYPLGQLALGFDPACCFSTSPSLSFLSFFIPLIIHNYHYNLFTNLHHFYRVVFRALLFTVVIEKVLYPSFNQVATNCQDFQVLQSSIAISSSFPSPSPNDPCKLLLQAKSRGFDQVIQEYPNSSIAPGPLHRYPFFILAASSIQASQSSDLIGD
ncbi:hypothetical protein PGT21_031115 [Puccinia graminis f. sp. tritici]|uniref:Uncharacterized protein n=1 Tax=Puccinia graminis f. sp. tritici TaxID=56615 RepID=A0A5B0Q7A6_PUCGR|nr:hypothetical protein PGT21_031115 [Puccinia graminis f. sp. tritici]